METRKVENKSLQQGNNEFESGTLMLGPNVTAKTGALLKRGANGAFMLVSDTASENPIAVNPVEVKNTGTNSGDFPIRALISGRVRFDMLSVNGQPITAFQGDLLRQYAGIIPIKATDLSWSRAD